MFSDIQNGIEHLAVRNPYVAPLNRQMWRDAFVLRMGEFHPKRIPQMPSLV